MTKALKNVCFAQFASHYTYMRANNISKDTTWKANASAEKGNLK